MMCSTKPSVFGESSWRAAATSTAPTLRRKDEGQHLNKRKGTLQVSTSTSPCEKKTESIQTQYMVPTTVPAPVLATGCRAMHDVGGARRHRPHHARNPDDCGHQPAAEASESEEQHHPPGPRRRRAGQEVSRGETLHRCVESVRPTAYQAKGLREWLEDERTSGRLNSPRIEHPQVPKHVCIKIHPPPIPPRNHPGCTALLYKTDISSTLLGVQRHPGFRSRDWSPTNRSSTHKSIHPSDQRDNPVRRRTRSSGDARRYSDRHRDFRSRDWSPED